MVRHSSAAISWKSSKQQRVHIADTGLDGYKTGILFISWKYALTSETSIVSKSTM